jgi:biopolymer transport protein ExbB/TolQ
MSTFLEYLDKGGWMMYVILGVSIAGATLFFERGFDLYIKLRLNHRGFLSSVLTHVEGRRFRQAIDACKVGSAHPVVAVLRAGLMRANRRAPEIERAMEKEMLEALPRLNKRVALLGFLANTCTLLGLLGTIFGLITAFSGVGEATAAERQAVLSNGISQAMYTTAFGIVVAVPLLFFHHLLTARQETIMTEMDGGATALMVALSGAAEADPTDAPKA